MFESVITSDDILGKEAIDPEGDFLGIIMQLHIDSNSKKILGITVDQGLWKPDLFVGIEFIKKFGIDAVFLNAIPISKYRGINVFSYDGILLGSITNVNDTDLKTKIFEITPKFSIKNIFSKRIPILIKESEILELGHSFILKKK